jgi:hypothetical protein
MSYDLPTSVLCEHEQVVHQKLCWNISTSELCECERMRGCYKKGVMGGASCNYLCKGRCNIGIGG